MIKQIPSLTPNKYQLEQMERKFGMFIHFGVNTFGNVEWSDGMINPRSYKPTEIDADGWVRTAYEAGMNYVIMITKHHDGFCLWNTEYTDYCVKNAGNTTDVVADSVQFLESKGQSQARTQNQSVSPYDYQDAPVNNVNVASDPFSDFGDSVSIDENFLD